MRVQGGGESGVARSGAGASSRRGRVKGGDGEPELLPVLFFFAFFPPLSFSLCNLCWQDGHRQVRVVGDCWGGETLKGGGWGVGRGRSGFRSGLKIEMNTRRGGDHCVSLGVSSSVRARGERVDVGVSAGARVEGASVEGVSVRLGVGRLKA